VFSNVKVIEIVERLQREYNSTAILCVEDRKSGNPKPCSTMFLGNVFVTDEAQWAKVNAVYEKEVNTDMNDEKPLV